MVRVHRGSPFFVKEYEKKEAFILNNMPEKKFKIQYAHSKGWLLFWVIVFFPVALVMLLTGAKFDLDGRKYFVTYEGSRMWLCFWVLACFPVAFILILLNGIAVVADGTKYSVEGSHRLEA